MVYSSPAPENFLAEYAAIFPTVEVDQWFWSLPNPATVTEYASSVGGDFRFTIKAPNSITLTNTYRHAKKNAGERNPDFLSVDLARRFLSAITPLQMRTDAIIFQFEYLNRTKMAGLTVLLELLEPFLASLPDGWPYAVELRNPNFLKRPYFEMLYRQGVVHVFSEGYYMPPVTDIYRYYHDLLISRSVIRLLGTERAQMDEVAGKRWDRRLSPKDEDLRRTAAMVLDMLDHDFDVTVNVNNHYEGSAPKTIEVLQKYLAS